MLSQVWRDYFVTHAACFRIVDFVVGVDIRLFHNRTAWDPAVEATCAGLGTYVTVNIGRFLSSF